MKEKITLENLRALVHGVVLNNYQKVLAINEFNIVEAKLKNIEDEMKSLDDHIVYNDGRTLRLEFSLGDYNELKR